MTVTYWIRVICPTSRCTRGCGRSVFSQNTVRRFNIFVVENTNTKFRARFPQFSAQNISQCGGVSVCCSARIHTNVSRNNLSKTPSGEHEIIWDCGDFAAARWLHTPLRYAVHRNIIVVHSTSIPSVVLAARLPSFRKWLIQYVRNHSSKDSFVKGSVRTRYEITYGTSVYKNPSVTYNSVLQSLRERTSKSASPRGFPYSNYEPCTRSTILYTVVPTTYYCYYFVTRLLLRAFRTSNINFARYRSAVLGDSKERTFVVHGADYSSKREILAKYNTHALLVLS